MKRVKTLKTNVLMSNSMAIACLHGHARNINIKIVIDDFGRILANHLYYY